MLTNIAPDLNKVYEEELGAQVLMRNWIAGDDQFFFSNKKLENPEDFVGLKTRSHSAELSDWINHMGAAAQFMAFAEVYCPTGWSAWATPTRDRMLLTFSITKLAPSWAWKFSWIPARNGASR